MVAISETLHRALQGAAAGSTSVWPMDPRAEAGLAGGLAHAEALQPGGADFASLLDTGSEADDSPSLAPAPADGISTTRQLWKEILEAAEAEEGGDPFALHPAPPPGQDPAARPGSLAESVVLAQLLDA